MCEIACCTFRSLSSTSIPTTQMYMSHSHSRIPFAWWDICGNSMRRQRGRGSPRLRRSQNIGIGKGRFSGCQSLLEEWEFMREQFVANHIIAVSCSCFSSTGQCSILGTLIKRFIICCPRLHLSNIMFLFVCTYQR